jgi:hypothetical protein
MAKLRVPQKAYRFKKRGKWHLINPRGDVGQDWSLSVCKFVFFKDTCETANVSTLAAEDLCLKCLGPLKAVESGKGSKG